MVPLYSNGFKMCDYITKYVAQVICAFMAEWSKEYVQVVFLVGVGLNPTEWTFV